MSNETSSAPPSWYFSQLGESLRCIRRDRAPIMAVTLLALVAGCIAGKATNVARSTAQLVMTPLPAPASPPSAETPDELSNILAPPMDVKTATLLCLGDETVQLLADKLNKSGKLESPIEDLWALKHSLDFEITIEYETPYETRYSPIIQLTSSAESPQMAKLVVDTWAKTCVELGERFRETRQAPTADAFAGESLELQQKLDTAEEQMEKFWRENSVELYNQRINDIIGAINDVRLSQVRLRNQIAAEGARVEFLTESLVGEQPTRKLRWLPASEIDRVLNGTISSVAPAAVPEGDGAATPLLPGELIREEINPFYEELRTEQVMRKAEVTAMQGELDRLDDAIAAYQEELLELQAKSASVMRLEKRITRETDVIESAYISSSTKFQYAQLASQLQQPPIQVLSYGAEWPLPRFRRAITFGAMAALVGCTVAAVASVLSRRVLAPALELSR